MFIDKVVTLFTANQTDNSVDMRVENDEYVVDKNADGTFTVYLGGVGLSNSQYQNLVKELKDNGTLPQDAELNTPVILPDGLTKEMKENG